VKATKVNAGLAESNGRLLLGIWHDSLHVTCGLTACTPGSAPGPMLGNEYGKTLPFYCIFADLLQEVCCFSCYVLTMCSLLQRCLVNDFVLSLTADLCLTMSTQVQQVPGFQFAGLHPRFSTSRNSAANRTFGHSVSICLQIASSSLVPSVL